MKKHIIAAVCLLSLISCKTSYQKVLSSPDMEAKYPMAFELFNAGKYSKAAQLFESMMVAAGGTSKDDTVQYYRALSNYRFSDYITAEANFEQFIDHFPRSPFTEDARFYRIECLFRNTYRYELDQTPTYKAVSAIGEYMAEYPDSPHFATAKDMLQQLSDRLDRKAYESAYLYYKMEDYKAAGVALRNILKDDADNIYREQILYYTAMASYKYAENSVPEKKKERFMVFEDDYYNFVGEYADSKYRPELDKLYKKVKGTDKNI